MMKFLKKKLGDKNGTPISFWSTDDNVLCEDGKTLRENLDEVDAQFKDIANNFSQIKEGNDIVLKYNNIEILRLSLNNITQEVIYGNINISVTSLEINENESVTFTVNLDKTPTVEQIVNISSNNENIIISPQSITFVANETPVKKTITVKGISDVSSYEDKKSVITLSSDNVENKTINVTVKNVDIDNTVYTITNTLTNFNNNNSVAEIRKGGSYSAKLTPIKQTISPKVTITMGGKDITSTSYSNNTVNINNITGDIVITASATLTNEELSQASTVLKRGHCTNFSNLGITFAYAFSDLIEVEDETLIISNYGDKFLYTVTCYNEKQALLETLNGDRGNTFNNTWGGTPRRINLTSGTKYIRIGFIGSKYAYNDNTKCVLSKDIFNTCYLVINTIKYSLVPYLESELTGLINVGVDGNLSVRCEGATPVEVSTIENIAVGSTASLYPLGMPYNQGDYYNCEFIVDKKYATVSNTGVVTRNSDAEFNITMKATDSKGNSFTYTVNFPSFSS
ncbi:MAG: hypothetical protein ACLR4X_12020 [Clostridia bacterium]